MNPSVRQIEREVEASREHLEETVEALKDKMTIGQMVDEAARYFDETGGSRLVSNLGAQVRDNPLPLLLVGVGLAWLMSGRGHPHVRSGYAYGAGSEHEREPFYPARDDYGFNGTDTDGESFSGDPESSALHEAGRIAQSVAEPIAGAAGAAASAIGEATSRLGSAAAAAASGASSTAAAVGDAVTAGARRIRHVGSTARHSGSAVYENGARIGSAAVDGASRLGEQASRGFSGVLEREPLVLGALGLAVGAAIGAMLPSTEAEDRLLGDQSDRLRDEASKFAQQKYEQGKTVVEETYRTATAEAEVQSGTGEGGLADRVGQVVKTTAEKARKTAVQEGLVPKRKLAGDEGGGAGGKPPA